jgi:N utilization substance protein A
MSEEENKTAVAKTTPETAETEAPVAPVKKTRSKSKKAEDVNLITGKVQSDSFVTAIGDIQKDSMVSSQQIADIITSAMAQAYLEWSYPGLYRDRDSTDPVKDLVKANVVFNEDFSSFKIFDVKIVCNEDDIVDDCYQISLEDAQAIKPDCKIGDSVEIPFDVKLLDKAYVRRVKQLYLSKLKDASRQAILAVYSNQIGGLIEGTVTKAEPEAGSYELSFGKADGFLRKGNLIPQDSFTTGERVLVYLSDVSDKMNPPSLVISRSSDFFIQKLLERNVPELQTGEVKIRAISREAGRRTKVFVEATVPNIDPIGTCIGPESSRVKAVMSELHGEKIDILAYKTNKAEQIIEAMKPATVIGMTCPDDFFDPNVHYSELEKDKGYEYPKITVVVMNGNQGVAIGSAGVNVRLASKITMATISVLQADEAIKQGLKYTLVPDIEKQVAEMNKAIEAQAPEAAVATEAQPAAAETAPVPAPEATPVAPAAVAEPAAATPVAASPVSEVKPVETPTAPAPTPAPAAAPVEHIEIKNKPKISLEELEAALSSKKGPSETHSYHKRWNHDDHKKDEETPSANTPAATPANAMPIYTEEELKAMEEQEKNGDVNGPTDEETDINVDEDDYDKYYDDKK